MSESYICLACLFVGALGTVACGSEVKSIQPDETRGQSAAVVVPDMPLAHTAQILPLDANGQVAGQNDLSSQAEFVLQRLQHELARAGSSLDQLVKLNVYATDMDAAEQLAPVMAKRFQGERKPAISFVTSPLPHPEARVAMDAVSAVPGTAKRSVALMAGEARSATPSASVAICPSGTRIYVAGQANQAETLAEATRLTMDSLRNTLRFLGRRDADIVQLKAFLSPMANVAEAHEQLVAMFGQDKLPPVVYVEWTTPLIEIELIAWGGDHQSGPVVEYLTPPGMTSSPIYSRVARVNSARSIYLSGLFGPADADASEETTGIFAQMARTLAAAESDLKHLVKATYYCANDDTSAKLNELRPNYYDPARPPSASKALVQGVGRAQRALTIDMIAVPAWESATDEYGPVEYGFGLTAEQAAAGWLSLYDGASTFGWRGARVESGTLSSGRTSAVFGACTVEIEAARNGFIRKGKTEFEVRGKQTLEFPDTAGPIELDDAIRVKSLRLQPAQLKTILRERETTGWQRVDRATIPAERRPEWSTSSGVLTARGGPGAFEYTEARYGDFVLQVEARTQVRHANGGVFVRAIPGDFMNGYEAQIYHRGLDGDVSRPARYSTGALDDHQLARRLVSRDGEFFVMTVVAHANHLATWVNGYPMTDWTDTREPHENPRQGLRLEPGTIQLQAHDPGTQLQFRTVRVSELKEPSGR